MTHLRATPPALSRATIDRAADRRRDDQWLADAWQSGRLLVVDDERRAVADEDGGLLLVDTTDYAGPRYFLGVDAEGASYWAGVGELPRRLGARPVTIRDVGATLPDRDAGLYVAAIALANWHATHVRCPRCGEPTEPINGGWVRRCVADGSEHFPRTDPAVIVLVHDGEDRCLLGRQPVWPPGRYSTLAGFVEPGESLEQAVAREVLEESGVVVDDIVYGASQPWPFPASLMLGFEARVVGGEAQVGDDELEDVRWFSRDDLRRGEPLLPPPASIAHWLITRWLGRG
jgi:NAD+ diphosphatase